MLEIFIAILIGIFLGTITGLTPGIHINLVAVLVVAIAPNFQNIDPLIFIITIISMGITHTFLDIIPSTYLGAPSEDTAIALLPSHRLLLQGKAYEAIRLATVGSLLGLIITIAAVPILIPVLKYLYESIKDYTAFILILATILLINREKEKLKTIAIFMLAGILGIYTLNSHLLTENLFPLLTGLFGTSSLILSLKNKISIPEQIITIPKLKNIIPTLGSGFLAATLTGFLPGLGAAQAAVIATATKKKNTPEDYIILTGSINTIAMIISLITFYAISKARNGAIIAIMKITNELTTTNLIKILAAILITAAISTFLALKLAKTFSKLITKINYSRLCAIIILLLTILTPILSGPYGLLVLITATAIGMLTHLEGVAKQHLMGCLILPIILFFLI